KRVLVIEDNDVNIMLLTMLLKKVGIVYDIAKDGEIGLQLFKDNKYDIILTDINVPKLTGDEIAILVRQFTDESKRNIPIVGLTATIVQDDLDEYIASGINEVLVKPFKQDELYATIEKYI
ncbi:MAG: response regulator, partial [Sediminibacterium sp.]|nr:response regulator [Sediminibacterium sp.]